jgi:hypothetical protein
MLGISFLEREIAVTKPRFKRKLRPEDIVKPEKAPALSWAAAAEPDGRPHFRHCADCGCFKSKHHGGVCRRHPQPLTKAASDGCWDGVPLPAPEGEGDEQITEVRGV